MVDVWDIKECHRREWAERGGRQQGSRGRTTAAELPCVWGPEVSLFNVYIYI